MLPLVLAADAPPPRWNTVALSAAAAAFGALLTVWHNARRQRAQQVENRVTDLNRELRTAYADFAAAALELLHNVLIKQMVQRALHTVENQSTIAAEERRLQRQRLLKSGNVRQEYGWMVMGRFSQAYSRILLLDHDGNRLEHLKGLYVLIGAAKTAKPQEDHTLMMAHVENLLRHVGSELEAEYRKDLRRAHRGYFPDRKRSPPPRL
jgi:hypothetical protein